jgi:hypothetical protein
VLRGPAHGVAEIAANARGDVPLVAFVVGLVLKEDELVCFIIGTVVCRVRHD